MLFDGDLSQKNVIIDGTLYSILDRKLETFEEN